MSATHRTAMGKPVDMAAIRTKNEKVRAIGNMQVNARGDIIDSNNQIVNQGSQRVNRVYNKTTVNPTARAKTQPAEPKSPPAAVIEEFSESEMEFDQELEEEIVPAKEAKSKKK